MNSATDLGSKAAHISGVIARPPTELKPWPNNPRLHSDKQLTKLKASIRNIGFTNPVLTDEDGMILSGHGRVAAACALKLATVPTIVISGLSQARKRALVLSENKLAELSKWDETLLVGEIKLLIDEDFPALELTGFDTPEIDFMIDPPTKKSGPDKDDLHAEDIKPDVVSRVSDLWLLGNHRLICGNSLQPATYERLMQGDKAQMTFCDPPFNVPVDGHVGGNGSIKHDEFKMASGEMSDEQFIAFLNKALSEMKRVSIDGAIHYVCMDWRHLPQLNAATMPVWGPIKQMCVWVKTAAGLGSFYRSQHEIVHVYKQGDAAHINNFGMGEHGRHRTNVWTYPGANSAKGRELLALHPTVKPVSMVMDAILDTSNRKGIVLDSFAGSGTILIAAERTGRHARAIELDPKYVDIAIHRWERVTGKHATLQSNGKTWAQTRDERLNTSDETKYGTGAGGKDLFE